MKWTNQRLTRETDEASGGHIGTNTQANIR